MKLSLKWLNEYVKVDVSVDELARKLTMAGLEIEGITKPGEGLQGVVVAQILASEKHPNADKLSVTKIDDGSGTPLQVVCGAKNYKVGDKIPLATVGSELPGGMKIGKARMRDVDSFGMLCSSKELGLTDESAGLLILEPSLKVGTPIAQALGLDDVIFEVNVTPNRSDALSHLGIAREVATLLGADLKKPSTKLSESSTAASSKIEIKIDDAERCWRYAARVIEGVTVKASPAWMQQRLGACGVRAINNLVDVGNYVMLEYGQPVHVFDLDRVGGGKIVVRTAKGGEKLKTLDEKERVLDAQDLLICDEKVPMVLAGVMGGIDSGVTEKTTRILLEAATFQPATIRRSSKRHALHSESSHRFERGTDVSVIPEAIDRLAALIVEIAGGTVLQGRVDNYANKKEPRQVTLRTSRVGELLGVEVPAQECERILSSLGFVRAGDAPYAGSSISGLRTAASASSTSTWIVPQARVDVSIEEDLIEEIARIRGFDAIPPALPRGLSALEPERPQLALERRMRSALAGQGFDEVVNYSFVAPADLAAFQAEQGAIAISNPLSVEQSVMRTTLFASLVPNIARSVRHQATGVRFYELGRSYRPHAGGREGSKPVAQETLELAGALYGGSRSWTGSKDADFYDARAAVESVLSALHIEGVTFEVLDSPWYHPRASAVVKRGDVLLGTVGELHPRAMKRLDAPAGVYLFQLDVAKLLESAALVPQAAPLSKFPSVNRDLAVVVPVALSADQVRSVILEVGKPLVDDAIVFDVYEGKQVGEGKKNLAFALRYRSAERTLTDTEVTEAHTRIVAEVSKRLGAALRA